MWIFSCCVRCEKIHTGEKPYACYICKFTELTYFLYLQIISFLAYFHHVPWNTLNLFTLNTRRNAIFARIRFFSFVNFICLCSMWKDSYWWKALCLQYLQVHRIDTFLILANYFIFGLFPSCTPKYPESFHIEHNKKCNICEDKVFLLCEIYLFVFNVKRFILVKNLMLANIARIRFFSCMNLYENLTLKLFLLHELM